MNDRVDRAHVEIRSKEDTRTEGSVGARGVKRDGTDKSAKEPDQLADTVPITPVDNTGPLASKLPSLEGATITSMNVLTNMYSPVSNPLKITKLNVPPSLIKAESKTRAANELKQLYSGMFQQSLRSSVDNPDEPNLVHQLIPKMQELHLQ